MHPFEFRKPRPIGSGRLIIAAVLGLLSLGAVALAFAATPEAHPHGGTIIVGIEAEPTTLNPYFNTGTETITPARNIFDQLVQADLSFTIKPQLAESWEVSPDGKSYTFHLFKNATWHDGKPVTSEDVKWSILEATAKYHPRLATLFRGAVKDVLTPDEQTAVVQLNEPFAPLLLILAAGGGPSILPKHIYGDGQDFKTHPANLKPVGSGPFKFKQWVKGSHLELERNPAYHLPGIPYLDRLLIQFLPDKNSRWLALETGEVDYLNYYIMPIEQIGRAKSNPNLVVNEQGGEGTGAVEVMILNMRSPILGKREVRQALAYAIDKNVLVSKAFQGYGRPARSIMYSGIKPVFNPNVPTYPRNLEKANQLLDTAGYPRKADGRRFGLRLLWATGRDVETSVAEVIRDQLREIGVEVELQKVDRATAIDQVYVQWNFDAVLWVLATGPDPTQQMTRSYHTRQIQHVAFTNASGYSNKVTDDLFDVEYKQVDPNERTKMWHQIQDIILTDVPVLPLVEMPVANVYNKRFHDVVADPFQNSPTLTYAWMEPTSVTHRVLGGRAGMVVIAFGVVVLLAAALLVARKRGRRHA